LEITPLQPAILLLSHASRNGRGKRISAGEGAKLINGYIGHRMTGSENTPKGTFVYVALVFIAMLVVDLLVVAITEIIISRMGWGYPDAHGTVGSIALEGFMFMAIFVVIVGFVYMIPGFRRHQKNKKLADEKIDFIPDVSVNVFLWIMAGIFIPSLLEVELLNLLRLSEGRVEFGYIVYLCVSIFMLHVLDWSENGK
jgi:hypothetical protein